MKKFLMYVVVLVTMLFIGYTTYYFVRNNENIYLTLAEGESIYLNKDETYDLPLVWTKPYSSTKVYENVQISDTSVVSFDETTKNAIGDLWMNFAWMLSSNSDHKTYRNRQLIYDSICILENKVGE